MSFAAKADAPDFEITVQPTDLTITKGQEGFFEASAITNKAITQFSWAFIGDNGPSFSLRGKSTTMISNAVGGLYRCWIIHNTGINSLVATATRELTLTINGNDSSHGSQDCLLLLHSATNYFY